MPLKKLPACIYLIFAWFLPHFLPRSLQAQTSPSCNGHANLNAYERAQFLEMSLGARAEVSAQYLSQVGCGRPMLEGLTGLGAKIDYSDEKSGFALVTIPKEKLLDSLDVAGLEYAYTRDDDRNYFADPVAKIPQSERKAEAVPEIAIPYPRVAKSLPPGGPFFAADVTGLTDLWKEHPEADGRGTRVVVADEGIDLLHPELQQARDAEGKIVPKVADLGTLSTPHEDASWVEFGEPISVHGGTFEAGGRAWTSPADGSYRFGIFKQDLMLGPENDSPATKKVSLSLGVLWDEATGKVWVDTNGNSSFADERALSDYGLNHDVAWFGMKEGDDDNRIPFGVKIDKERNAVYVRIGGEHGNLVSGALAGNTWTGGLYDGAAPSAQVIDESLGRADMLAQLVRSFARADTDVLNRSGGLGRSGYTGNREGIEDFAQHVVEREVAVYQKPIATYTAAIGGIHVNDYAGPEMLKRNRQVGPPYKDTINSFVWDGLLNVVLAPSANLETDSRYKPSDLIYPDGIRYMWQGGKMNPPAPAGYVMGANNSPTIPVVSGLLADLISEARKEKVRYNATRLNNALFTGAHLLEGIPVSRQGYGLINAADSWKQLEKMSQADDPANPELTSFSVAGAGKNLEPPKTIQEFHKDLNHAGEKVEGEIWVTRHGGYAVGRKYQLRLRGDAGSFTLLDHQVTLTRDKPARVRFRASGAPGWNIALLELRDAKADVVMEDVPLSVRAPEAPEKIAPGVDKVEATIPPLTSQNAYVQVGDEVQAARYVMKIPYTGPENISTRGFPGGRYRTSKTPDGDPVDAAHHVGPMETLESLVINDAPGNQGIFWENRGRPEYATQYDGPSPDVPIHAELTVTKFAVGIERQNDSLKITNRLAAIDGRVELYDASLEKQSLTGSGPHAMGTIETTLPEHLAEWRVDVTSDTPAPESADVYLLNCAGKNGCVVEAQEEIAANAKTITIDKPEAGKWKILVRSRGQVKHAPSFTIHQALLTPATTSIDASDSEHASGSSWALPLPAKQSDTQYAAFRIAGKKNGLVIAMTPLDTNAP